MKISGVNPALVGPATRPTPYASRPDDAPSRGRGDAEQHARFVEKATALKGAAGELAHAIEATQRVVTSGHVTSSRTLGLDEALLQMAGTRTARRMPDSKRPMAQVPALSSVRRGDFSVNGYQIDVDPFSDSLTDVLARVELLSPNTRATFSAATNKVMLASRGDRRLVLADGEAAFLQAISVLPGRFAADAARDAEAAQEAARAAEAASAQAGQGDSLAAEEAAKAAQQTADRAAQAAEQSAARAEIESAVSRFQEAFNQFAAIEEPLVTYDNGGKVTVAASGRTQLDRVVSAGYSRAGLEGASLASARFDVGPELSFRFDNPRGVMQVDANAIAEAVVNGGSVASRFLLGDPAEGSTGLVQELSGRLTDFLQLARGEATIFTPVGVA
ncbi:MAG: hypothetical protein AMXMBFR64_06840 [Myxococcales bacterium]